MEIHWNPLGPSPLLLQWQGLLLWLSHLHDWCWFQDSKGAQSAIQLAGKAHFYFEHQFLVPLIGGIGDKKITQLAVYTTSIPQTGEFVIVSCINPMPLGSNHRNWEWYWNLNTIRFGGAWTPQSSSDKVIGSLSIGESVLGCPWKLVNSV